MTAIARCVRLSTICTPFPGAILARRTQHGLSISTYLRSVTTTLQDPRVAAALERMYATSTEQFTRIAQWRADFERLATASAQERADGLSEIYMPVTPEAGRLLYSLVRASRPATVV